MEVRNKHQRVGITSIKDPNDLYDNLEIKKDLVTGFSILFSRFEYALKRTDKYLGGNEKRVWANWGKFAQDHKDLFDEEKTPELKSAVEYLQKHPPKKQILKNGKLGWKDVSKQNTPLLQQVLSAIGRVRNNLFHGGKFQTDPGRNRDLLNSCVTVLEECLSLNEEVKKYFPEK